jgi:rhodanese-related sulfurtransferase
VELFFVTLHLKDTNMKFRLLILLLIWLIVPVLTAQTSDTLKYIVLSPADFLSDLKSSNNKAIIDVRKNKDYRKSRIEGAINIEHPVSEAYFTTPGAINIQSSLFIYCYAGFSSRKAAVIFYDHGYRNICSLEGGFMKWKSKKLPTDKKKIKDKS